jgi:hypothetical protein
MRQVFKQRLDANHSRDGRALVRLTQGLVMDQPLANLDDFDITLIELPQLAWLQGFVLA